MLMCNGPTGFDYAPTLGEVIFMAMDQRQVAIQFLWANFPVNVCLPRT